MFKNYVIENKKKKDFLNKHMIGTNQNFMKTRKHTLKMLLTLTFKEKKISLLLKKLKMTLLLET